jgi:hypothetical protein
MRTPNVSYVSIVTRLIALGIVLVTLVAPAGASSATGDLYAFRFGPRMNLLVPYDPIRLVPAGATIRMGHFGQAWSTGPDRSRLVAAAGWRPTKGEPAALRFVDLVTGRVEGTATLAGELRRVAATTWIGDRVLAILSASSSTTIDAVDAETRTMVASVDVPGVVVVGERTPSSLVLVLAQPDRIGPATIAVVDRAARVRTVQLDRIAAGTTVTGMDSDRRAIVRRPALTLSRAGDRAFVLGAGEPAATIDLRTLAVRYAPVRVVAAARKQVEGAVRRAETLPDGRIVVGGVDFGSTSPVGLSLVDPRDWSARVLDPAGSWFRVAGGLVFVRGNRGVGLRTIEPSGATRVLFRNGSAAAVNVVGRRALVTFFGTGHKAAVIDLATGRVVRRTIPAHLLVGAGQPIVG